MPCMNDKIWVSTEEIVNSITYYLIELALEIPKISKSLPFRMPIYKLHKKTCRWIISAQGTIFSMLAHILIVALMRFLPLFKEWVKVRTYGYEKNLQTKISIFWIVESIIDFSINMPKNISYIFVVDITQSNENIPIHGEDNLGEAYHLLHRQGMFTILQTTL